MQKILLERRIQKLERNIEGAIWTIMELRRALACEDDEIRLLAKDLADDMLETLNGCVNQGEEISA